MSEVPEEVMARVKGVLTDLALSMLDDVLSALTAEGYMVVRHVPFEWGGIDYDYAKTPLGVYSVIGDDSEGWFVSTAGLSYPTILVTDTYPSREAARAACQADYKARILACFGAPLLPTPEPAP